MDNPQEYWRVYDWIRNAFPYDSEEQIGYKVQEYINRSRKGDAPTSPSPKQQQH